MLEESCTKQGTLHYLELLGELKCEMKENKKVRDYWIRFMTIYDKLVLKGNTFSDKEVAHVVLWGLLRSFSLLNLHLEKESATLTQNTLKPQLILEKQRLSRHGDLPDVRAKAETKSEVKALYVNDVKQKKTFGRKGRKSGNLKVTNKRWQRWRQEVQISLLRRSRMVCDCPFNWAPKKEADTPTNASEQPKKKRTAERINTKLITALITTRGIWIAELQTTWRQIKRS